MRVDNIEPLIALLPSQTPADFERQASGRRMHALTKLLKAAADKNHVWQEIERLWESAPTNVKGKVVDHPLFFDWIRAYAGRVKSASTPTNDHFARRLSTLIGGAAIASDTALPRPVPIAADIDGIVTLIGTNRKIASTTQDRSLNTASLILEGRNIRLAWSDGMEVNLPADFPRRGRTVYLDQGIAIAAGNCLLEKIEVITRHASLESFLLALDPERETGLRIARTCASATLRKLESALHEIEKVWPDISAELFRQVSALVPIYCSERLSFTNPAWQGALFINQRIQEIDTITEALVHEASHLYLNTFLSVGRLHEWGNKKTVESPFRAGPRPMDALFHGVFVFSRVLVWCSLRQAPRMLATDGRVDKCVVERVKTGAETLRRTGGLTEAGRALLNEIDETLSVLLSGAGCK